ncbi:MAG: hypothetical protein QNJ26_04890 [Desulfobacterales bacterium]|nr:hypothetical protein [Desulfobacterales bacterium]
MICAVHHHLVGYRFSEISAAGYGIGVILTRQLDNRDKKSIL